MIDDQQAAAATAPNSKAVIFFRLDGGSEVLWWQGPDIEAEIREAGTDSMDLGFEHDRGEVIPPREGFLIWEGCFAKPAPHGDALDDELLPMGTLRELTAGEWAAVREGRNPFVPPRAPPVDWRDRDLAQAAAQIERLRLQLMGCGVAARGEAFGEADAREGDYGWSRSFEAVKHLHAKYSKLVVAARDIANGIYAGKASMLCGTVLSVIGEPLKRSLTAAQLPTPASPTTINAREGMPLPEKYAALLGVARELAKREPVGSIAADIGPATCRLVLRTIGEPVEAVLVLPKAQQAQVSKEDVYERVARHARSGVVVFRLLPMNEGSHRPPALATITFGDGAFLLLPVDTRIDLDGGPTDAPFSKLVVPR